MGLFQDKLQAFLVILLVAFLGVIIFFGRQVNIKSRGGMTEINYEMARPKSFLASLFDLTGREILRTFKKFTQPEHDVPAAPEAIVSEDDAEASAEQTETEAQAMQQQEKLRSAYAQRLKSAIERKTREDEAKAKEVADAAKAAHAENDADGSHSKDSSNANEGAPVEPPQKPRAAEVNPGAPPDSLDNDQNENTKKISEWRELLESEPTVENMKLFMQAHQAKEVNSEQFYGLTDELLKSNVTERNTIAVYGLTGFPSARSFSLLAHYSEEGARVDLAQVNAVLYSYSGLQKMQNLEGVLASRDDLATAKALSVLKFGIEGAGVRNPAESENTESANVQLEIGNRGRNSFYRGQSYAPTLNAYTRFIVYLEPLASDVASPLSTMASQLLNTIKSNSSAVAPNAALVTASDF